MNNSIWWAGGGCGSMNICRQGDTWHEPILERRQNLINNIAEWHGHHSGVTVDPLIYKLVIKLNSIKGITTRSSCQGKKNTHPYVEFTADLDAVERLHKLIRYWHHKTNTGAFYDNIIIQYYGFNRWLMEFYDVLAVIQFTDEAFVDYEEKPEGPIITEEHSIIGIDHRMRRLYPKT